MVTTRPITAEDVARLPDDGYRYDLIRGRVIRMAPAGGEHGGVAYEFGRLIGNHVVPRKLGKLFAAETGFLLAREPDTVLAPDVALVRAERLPRRDELIGFPPVAPDLVVEVVSPSDREDDLAAKVAAYLEAGVRLVLVARPRPRTITMHSAGQSPVVLGEHDKIDGGGVLPGFRVQVGDIFG